MSNYKHSVGVLFLCVTITFCLQIGNASNIKEAAIQVNGPGKAIASDLWGIFFEDINYAADGGLYAELVQNRSFEYNQGDNKEWNALSYWELIKRGRAKASVSVESVDPLNDNNPHYAVLTVEQVGERVGLRNSGYDGIVIEEGESYDVSLFARVLSGRPRTVTVRLESDSGKWLGDAKISNITDDWAQYKATIKAEASGLNANLQVLLSEPGTIAFDMISLFPKKTFRNRPNGLRQDLAQIIADLKPKFIRFPGGCVAHGHSLENMYRWKDTIGPLEQRKVNANFWGYHQSVGLGYFEYFQFCEDIDAKPLPVVPAGVSCQFRRYQCIPMDQMPDYVQEVLDLIEWANGSADSKWGAKRAAAGHPEPFNLEYVGLGNEDLISPEFKKRYKMINDAVKEKYPNIVVIGTTGPGPDGSEYEEGWKFARKEKLPMVDEHGYRSPLWFWQNLEHFDTYDRASSLVYLGEYAAHDHGRRNTLRSALAEAAYNTAVERNADLVRMASYAPLLAKEGHTQWRPDMIYFDNISVTPSLNYHVQKLFNLNAGDVYLPTSIAIETKSEKKENPIGPNGIMLGTWETQAHFDDIKVVDSSGKILFKESFGQSPKQSAVASGQWRTSAGVYEQRSNDAPALTRFAFPADPSGYTLTLRAMKTGGNEGFLIGFGAIDPGNYFWWNLGGWKNTRYAVEGAIGGSRNSIGEHVNGRIELNRWYDIKIKLSETRIRCYLDGRLIQEIERPSVSSPDLAASCVRDSVSGDTILKIVSKADEPIPTRIDLSKVGPFASTAAYTILTGDPDAENRFGKAPELLPKTTSVKVSDVLDMQIPAHSFTVIRLQSK